MLEKNNISLLGFFLIFVKIGAILLGGGYVILPIIISEFSTKRNLITEEDIINYYAVAQALPGIVAANVTMFIGYRLKGFAGALVAMIGIIFVPFLLIVLIASVLDKLVNNTYIQGALWGVGIAVIALITLTIREMWQKSNRDMFFYLIFLCSLIALIFFKLSPVQTILTFVMFGVLIKKFIEVQR